MEYTNGLKSIQPNTQTKAHWRFPRMEAIVLLAMLVAFAPAAIRAGGLVDIDFDVDDFTNPTTIDNTYWPMVPGELFVYHEVSADECIVEEFLVTSDTKSDFTGPYAGLTARVISDMEWLDLDCEGDIDVDDLLKEETFDWYAQDDSGNIWYLGEDTTAYRYDDEGNLIGSSTGGSWEAGIDGADAGIIMLADPAPGLFYRQEFFEGEAEDMGKVLRLNSKVEIALGSYSNCLVTKEWNRLEGGSVEHKYYCPPDGLVYVEELSGGKTTHVEAIELP